ncbi:MAG TPA: DUF3108 domain-containing protein [Bryobacteraceae bacterium]|nr:DUF3108 domain-containing protein [Bryobacteraceae bacterium]
MRRLLTALAALLASQANALAQSAPWPDAETLTYTVNWPSGLSLGEAELQAARRAPQENSPARWELRFTLDAAVPGFTVADRLRSAATPELCSIEFERDTTHGRRSGKEVTTFDVSASTATRQTVVPAGGGRSQMTTPPCAKDALAFLYFVRRELAEGRLAQSQTIFFGGPYQISFELGGRQKLRVGEEQFDVDRITALLKGPSTNVSFEVYFAQDRARRPVLIRVPLPLGAFTMELNP